MNSTRKRDLLLYGIVDAIMAVIAWAYFSNLELDKSGYVLAQNINLQSVGISIFILTGWLLLYVIFDCYNDLYRQSRLTTFTRTFFISALGCIVIILLGDDLMDNHLSVLFFKYFSIHFTLTTVSRMILLTRASRRLKSGAVTFNTLIIG